MTCCCCWREGALAQEPRQQPGGEVRRLRYATKVSSSNQGRGVRKVRVVEGEHEDSRFQRGPIITVNKPYIHYKPMYFLYAS